MPAGAPPGYASIAFSSYPIAGSAAKGQSSTAIASPPSREFSGTAMTGCTHEAPDSRHAVRAPSHRQAGLERQQSGEQAVDEGGALVGRQAGRQLDGLAHDDGVGDVVAPQQLVDAQPQD